jgi:hypothetical protein
MKWLHDYIRVERGAHAELSRRLSEPGQGGWQVSAIIIDGSDMIAYIQKYVVE